MPDEPPVPDPTEPDVPATYRPTFFDEVALQSQQFGKDLLQLIPEMDGVAIVPSWSKDYGSHIFPGVMVGRHGDGLRPPMETMHMAVQLHRTLQDVVRQSFNFLKYLDSMTTEKLQQLHELEGRLAQHADNEQPQPPGRDATGGVAPASPPEGEHL